VGLWDDFTDAVSDAAEGVYDSVAGGAVGEVVAAGARAVDTATFGVAGRALHAADDYVFDTVDYVTAGAVDVDFDGGQFTVGAGFDGLARVGASVGEEGIGASGEALLGGAFDVAMTRDGFLASGHAGIDWGPLPYAEGHVELRPNGDVVVDGRVQGTIPTPYGIFSGEASAGFTSTDAGWGGYLDSQGRWITPTGVTVGGGQHLAYRQNADGSSELSVGVNGSVGYAGGVAFGGGVDYARAESAAGDVVQSVGVDGHVSYLGVTARGGVDYDRAETADGDVVEGVQLHGEVGGYGMAVSGDADYRHTEIDGVERSDWSGDADVDGPSLEGAARAATRLAGDDPDLPADIPEVADLPDPVAVVAEPVSAMAGADAAEQSLGDLTEGLAPDLP
jgi:hypothetical protein